MPVHEDLSVSYHQQDTDYYCGAACAQMVLDQIGAGLLGQDGLYAENHSHSTTESGWSTAPDGLQYTMNDQTPPGNPTGLPHGHPYFVIDAEPNEDTVSRAIVWTIHNWRVAPIAMVYHSQHWIVVRGYTASAAPSSFSDPSYSISGFDVNNPWPPVPSWYTPSLAPPPPHSGSDGCGSGGDRGVVDEHLSYAVWQSTYMTGIDFGHWLGQYVAICDPDPPPSHPGVRPFAQERMRSEGLLSAEMAVKRAQEGLSVYGLDQRKNYAGVLRRGRPGTPVLVERLDHPDQFYYVVPVTEDERTAPLAIVVDAITGIYLQSAINPKPGETVFTAIGRDAVLETIAGRVVELPNRVGRLQIRPEALCFYPRLVWKPCRESLSPYYPFYMFTAGAYHVYVRSDGAVFTELHDGEHGI
ncbi:MAG TPA: hypothetical protein VN893_12520 [Bryobacteraceae bacterium]|nr:hypothetical protein [Bryobacteraceae bacterium]